MELMIIDENGWSKIVDIRKAITRIGSAPSNDIQLDTHLVAPVHLQIIYSAEHPSSCKLTNLSTEISIHTGLDDFMLPSYQTIDLRDGSEIRIGGFRLVPRLPLTAGYNVFPVWPVKVSFTYQRLLISFDETSLTTPDIVSALITGLFGLMHMSIQTVSAAS